MGPSLTPFGVTGALADPQLQLFTSPASSLLDTNDHWGGTPALAASFAALGAFALPPASLDSALARMLPPGNYTVQITGAAGTTGIALAELYDADPTPLGAPTLVAVSRFNNASARALVTGDGGILIAGFVINGNLPKTILVRAIGPALTGFGVAGVLADPRLEPGGIGGGGRVAVQQAGRHQAMGVEMPDAPARTIIALDLHGAARRQAATFLALGEGAGLHGGAGQDARPCSAGAAVLHPHTVSLNANTNCAPESSDHRRPLPRGVVYGAYGQCMNKTALPKWLRLWIIMIGV
jgi:hypothetical protein